MLTRAAEIHREQADELAKLLTLEMGKPIAQAKGEVQLVASIYQYYADHVAEFMSDEPLTIAGPGTAVVRTEPIGPLVGVMPWNYPYYQVARFAAPNIALGNTIILKHARNCPQSALAVERVLLEAGLPEGVYLNAFISTAQVAAAIADPRVQGVSVTGSEKAGSAVGEVAGRHMKKVVLELGGSDPFVVLADADVDAAAKAAVVGRLANGGQACTASKRFIVDDRVYDEFVQKLIDGMAGWQPADPTSPETKLGPLASNSGAEELDELVQEAISRGAEVLLMGGDRPTGAYYPPTVLARVTRGMRAYSEELFGPVAVVYRVGFGRRGDRAGQRLAVRPCLERVHLRPGEGRPGGRAARDRHGVDQQHQQDLAGPAVRRGQGLRRRPRAGPVRIRRIRQQEAREKPERTTEMTTDGRYSQTHGTGAPRW